MRDRQEKGKLTDAEKATIEKERIFDEIQFLEALNRNYATKDGEMIINWLLRFTNPLASPVDNSGKIGFRLGIQEVGKVMTIKLINAGCDLKVTDFVGSIDKNKLKQLHNAFNKLNKETK